MSPRQIQLAGSRYTLLTYWAAGTDDVVAGIVSAGCVVVGCGAVVVGILVELGEVEVDELVEEHAPVATAVAARSIRSVRIPSSYADTCP